jgi:hypothetical protein
MATYGRGVHTGIDVHFPSARCATDQKLSTGVDNHVDNYIDVIQLRRAPVRMATEPTIAAQIRTNATPCHTVREARGA